MNKYLQFHILALSLIFSCWSHSLKADSCYINNEIIRISPLPIFLNETSSLCETNEGIWSINDSHNPSELFLLNRRAYQLWRDSAEEFQNSDFTVFEISNSNNDWEAMETDGVNLYLGDFGNNSGTRVNLKIVIINLDSLRKYYQIKTGIEMGLKPSNSMSTEFTKIDCRKLVNPEINFKYPKQNNFNKRKLHNYDCEAMVVNEQSIFLLSKNWKSLTCDMYKLPKSPGSYEAQQIGKFNPRFLITDVSKSQNTLFVCGYGPSGKQYVGQLNLGKITDFEKQKSASNFIQIEDFYRFKLPIKPAQVEGIHFDQETQQILLSTESRKSQIQSLFLIKTIQD